MVSSIFAHRLFLCTIVASSFFLGRIDNNAITSLSDGIGRAGWTETQLCAKGVGGMEIRGTGTPRWRSRRAIPVTETHRTRRAVASGFAVFGSRGKGTHRPRRMTSCCFRRRHKGRFFIYSFVSKQAKEVNAASSSNPQKYSRKENNNRKILVIVKE